MFLAFYIFWKKGTPVRLVFKTIINYYFYNVLDEIICNRIEGRFCNHTNGAIPILDISDTRNVVETIKVGYYLKYKLKRYI